MKINAKQAVIWVGWAISLLFFIWAAAKIDFGKAWESMKMADYRLFLPAVILNIIIMGVRSMRWRIFIEPVKKLPFMPVFSALTVGYMANMILPARIGEVVRALVISEQENIPKGAAFGTVVVERVFDGLSAGVFMALVILWITPTPEQMENYHKLSAAILSASAIFIAAFMAVYLFHKRVRPVVWLIETATGMLPEKWGSKIHEALESLRHGLDSIDHGHRIARIVMWSVPVWALAGPFNYLFIVAFNLDLPLQAGFLVLVTQMFGLMAPSAPGFLGVYHAATMAGLMFYGVDQDTALSVAVVMHLVVFFAQTIPGFYFMWRMKYSLGQIKQREEKAEVEGLNPEL